MAEQRPQYHLSTKGQLVMDILYRQESGYGREQLLLVALRLACREQRGPGVPEGDLVLDYLLAAEVLLKGDPDA